MLPVLDVIPCRTRPWVTVTLIAATTAGLACEWWLPAGAARGLAYTYGYIPLRPHWPALVTSLLLHAGLVHAASNLISLWVLGSTLEDRFGHLRFLALYLVSGIAGTLAAGWALPLSATPIIGASGAVAGVTAAYLMLFPRSRVLLLIPLPILLDLVEVPALFMPGFWFLLQVMGTVAPTDPGTAIATLVWLALGGSVVGLVSARLAVKRERLRVEWWSA